jgi:hypothetical protein
MRRLLSCFAAPLGVLLFWAAPVRAEPITITLTSGTIDVIDPLSSFGMLRLFGTGGFSFVSRLSEGRFDPAGCCLEPGDATRFSAEWDGSSLGGAITYGGKTFTDIGRDSSPNGGAVGLTSSFFTTPPAPAAGVTATIVAPFTLTGLFLSPTVSATFTGRGIGHLSLVSTFTGSLDTPFAWITRDAHLDITSVTPEPTSLVLLGLGIVGVWSFRRRGHEEVAQ